VFQTLSKKRNNNGTMLLPIYIQSEAEDIGLPTEPSEIIAAYNILLVLVSSHDDIAD